MADSQKVLTSCLEAASEQLREAKWCGKRLSALPDAELDDAAAFCEAAYDTLRDWSPVAVWAFFSERLAELTVERAKRMGGASAGRRGGV